MGKQALLRKKKRQRLTADGNADIYARSSRPLPRRSLRIRCMYQAESKVPHSLQRQTDKSDSFRYPAIDLRSTSIRLLTIVGRDNDIVRCEMKVGTLQSSYFALSYAWGPEDASRTISINGYPMRIRTNLYSFLATCASVRLDHPLYKQQFWIDAVCIDQRNTSEKNHQVRQMDRIYKNAQQVIVWLGQDAGEVEDLLAFMGRPNVGRHDLGRVFVKGERRQIVRAMPILARLPYWNRLWIVPEVLNATCLLLCCGAESVQWPIFVKFFLSIYARSALGANHQAREQTEEFMDGPMARLIKNKDEVFFVNTGGTFQELFAQHGKCLCSDSRDKVYALMAIAGDWEDDLIDYNDDAESLLKKVLPKFTIRDPWNPGSAIMLIDTLASEKLVSPATRKSRHDLLTWQISLIHPILRLVKYARQLRHNKCLLTQNSASVQLSMVFLESIGMVAWPYRQRCKVQSTADRTLHGMQVYTMEAPLFTDKVFLVTMSCRSVEHMLGVLRYKSSFQNPHEYWSIYLCKVGSLLNRRKAPTEYSNDVVHCDLLFQNVSVCRDFLQALDAPKTSFPKMTKT